MNPPSRLRGLYPKKLYAFPEWGVWESDNPEFIRTMARFARTDRRVELLVYNPGKPGSPSDLGPRPRSRAADRAAIRPLGRWGDRSNNGNPGASPPSEFPDA